MVNLYPGYDDTVKIHYAYHMPCLYVYTIIIRVSRFYQSLLTCIHTKYVSYISICTIRYKEALN